MIRMMCGRFYHPRVGKPTQLLLFYCALGAAGCPAPGEGAKAEAGYRRAAPVIAALERYQRERGAYPDTLARLPAEWLPAQETDSPAGPPLRYVRRGERYELSFSYTGPGVNHCTYTPSSDAPAHWHCGGYY